MKFENGVLSTTIPNQFDGQIHSVEWFHNGQWRRIKDTIYPLQDTEVLDDTLDSGGFCFTNELSPYPDEWKTDANGRLVTDKNGNKVENPDSIKFLKQLTPIRIIWDSNDDFKSADRNSAFDKDLQAQLSGKIPVKNPMYRYRIVDEVNVHGEGRLFKFAVKTVEATKLLELVQCDTMTFTNYLIRGDIVPMSIFAVGTKYDVPRYGTIYYNSLTDIKYNVIRTPFILGSSYTLPYAKDIFNMKTKKYNYFNYEIYIKNPSSNSRTKVFWSTNGPNGWQDEGNRLIQFNEIGTYTIYYEIHEGQRFGGLTDCYSAVKYEIAVFNDLLKHTNLTITRVLERILHAGETRRKYVEDQRFVLAKNLSEKFKNYPSPEFCITRATFWEALKTVAGHVHCIPRLNWDEESNSFRIITFDELGQMEECKLKAMHNNHPIAWDIRKSLDSYCGEINTYVDNLVNTKDDIAGTIVEPYEGGWKSARASDGELIVKDDTVVFSMSRPNMRVSKLEIRYDGKEADITKYLFEAAEYKALSTFDGDFPNSTGRALKYEQGGKEITEIAHTGKKLTNFGIGVSELLNKEAIRNIAEGEGINIPSGLFRDIQYRVTYSPISSARVVQDKPYIDDCNGYSRNYNVAGNMIESEYLGEHLKGAIARLGNDIEYRTYMFERGKDVPKPGTLLDGKYIMKATTQMSTVHFIKATLVLSNDYNQKNEYVAIDSNIRYYDVSEKQSVERHINYKERVIIGDELPENDNPPMSKSAMNAFSEVFSGKETNKQISWAWFKGDNCNEIFLPCLSQAEGNSLIFNFACQDNYSAGWNITNDEGSYPDPNNAELTMHSSVQTQVPYADSYGEFEHLVLRMGNNAGLKIVGSLDELLTKLPLWTPSVNPTGLISTESHSLIISKDSREQINFTYQLNLVANRRSIIIGTALCNDNPLVKSNDARIIAIYWLYKPLNKFDVILNLSDKQKAKRAEITDDEKEIWAIKNIPLINKIKFVLPALENKSGEDAKAIAFVDITNGEEKAKLLIGENIDVKKGELSKAIYFNFMSNE